MLLAIKLTVLQYFISKRNLEITYYKIITQAAYKKLINKII